MTISIGDYIFTQQTSGPDSIGASWIYVTRREVSSIDGTEVCLYGHSQDEFPEHSPPAVEDIGWFTPSHSIPIIVELGLINEIVYLTSLSFPDPYVITDEPAVRAARHLHRNHIFVNFQAGKAKPVPTDLEAFEYHVLDWRDPR